MKGKIAFEEHMAIEETLAQTKDFAGDSGRFDEFSDEILDLDELRLATMDRTGIELALLSLNAPAVQAILDRDEAVAVAVKANKRMAKAVNDHPDRYRALAALPMQDPEAAADELKRCVNELGFKGALVNGFTQRDVEDSAIYYDVAEYRDGGVRPRCAVLPAPAHEHTLAVPYLRGPPVAAERAVGIRRGNVNARAASLWFRTV
jgi:2,3-dihydroxybenzoate decarboxylase